MNVQKISQAAEHVEQGYGAAMSYAAAGTTAGIAAWVGNNWFLLLSAVALLVRIGIDLPKLWQAWKKKDEEK